MELSPSHSFNGPLKTVNNIGMEQILCRLQVEGLYTVQYVKCMLEGLYTEHKFQNRKNSFTVHAILPVHETIFFVAASRLRPPRYATLVRTGQK